MKSNPLSLRLSYNKYWLNQDSIRFKNISLYYSYNINLDRLISNFLLSQKLRKLGIIYSHTVCKFNTISTYNVVKCVNKLIKLNIFLADIRLIKIYFIKNFLISPIVVVRYISFKLKMRYRIGELVKPIPKTYYRFGIANGIRIDCAGRFTRKQRASFSKYTRGSIAQTTISKYVSYDIGVSKSKYGACSVKYWLFH